jgi:hypothetical protein
MPIIPDLELPIERVKVSGPAVDALERRKETNNDTRASAAEFRQKFALIKDVLLSRLRQLTAAI